MKQKKEFQSVAYRFKRFVNKSYSAFNSMHKVVNIGVITCCTLTFVHTTNTTAQTIEKQHLDTEKISDQSLDEIVIVGVKPEDIVNQTNRIVTVITKTEIAQSSVQSIQDLLNYAIGIDIQQRGGHGVQTDISIRGGSFDQTAILLNGINLSNPQTGHFSFDIPINLSDIERIEIIRGPSTITYGASAFSGGINIVTTKNPEYKAYGKIETGGHNLFSIETKGVLPIKDNITNQLSASYKTSSGYISNSDYDISNLLWQTQVQFNQSYINLQAGYSDKRYGANTFYSATYPNQYDKTKSYFASLKTNIDINRFTFMPSVYWNRHDDCFQLFRDGTSNIPSWYKGHNFHQTDIYGTNINLQYRSILGVTNVATEVRHESIKSNVLGFDREHSKGKYTKSDNRTNLSYALEQAFVWNQFSASAGLLLNYNTNIKDGYKLYPSIQIGYQIKNNIQTYVSWSQSTRIPTFTDLYYTTATHIGNYDLKSEKSESFEIGFEYSKSFLQAYVSGYYMKAKNLIDWVKENPDDKWESKNLTQIDKIGFDVGLKFFIDKLFENQKEPITLDLGYSRLNQDKNSDKYISNYALNYLRDKVVIGLRYPVLQNTYLSLNYRWQHRMGTYIKYKDLNPSKEVSFDPFSTLDAKLIWNKNNIGVTLSANNIFDKKYVDIGNVPQAGFWLIGGISYTLK